MKQYFVNKYNSELNSFDKEITTMSDEEFLNFHKAKNVIDIKVNGKSINAVKKGTVIIVTDKYKFKHRAEIVNIDAISGINKVMDGYTCKHIDSESKYPDYHFYSIEYILKEAKKQNLL